MSNKTGHETITFNAYGVRDILQGNVRDNLVNAYIQSDGTEVSGNYRRK